MDLSSSVLSAYANENLVLGDDFNCVMNAMDKKGGRPFDSKNAAVIKFESTIRVHSFVDAWRIVQYLAQYRFHLEQLVDEDTKQTSLFFHPKIFAKVNSRFQNHAQHLLRSFCFNSHHLF